MPQVTVNTDEGQVKAEIVQEKKSLVLVGLGLLAAGLGLAWLANRKPSRASSADEDEDREAAASARRSPSWGWRAPPIPTSRR